MLHFDSDGIDIAYLDEGAGDPILLIHGFGTNARINWMESGWARALIAARRRVIAYDNCGHGESARLYEPSAYRMPAAAADARRLLDHLALERVDVMGYSMGARIAATLAVADPQRVRSLILGGMGESLVTGLPAAHAVAAALRAPRLDDVVDESGRMFREFAERTKGDLEALAACMSCPREPLAAESLAGLPMPVLIAIGANDTIAGPLSRIAACMPKAELFEIADRDHMRAVSDASFRARVLAFLAARP